MSSSVGSIALIQKRVGEMLPGLSKAEAEVLGLLSFGILMLDGCGITRLSNGLAKMEQVPAQRLRQRLREFYYEAEAKRGKKRREVKVEACFADLLRGVLRGWEGKKELGCEHTGGAVHGALDQHHVPRVWYPNRMENHPGNGRRSMASALGRTAWSAARGGAARLEGDHDG